MALGWTIIFSTLDDGVDSFTMMGSHDNEAAWQEALSTLLARYGSDSQFILHAISKGLNPTYTGRKAN